MITERRLSVRRREEALQASCHSLNSSKSVSIHPEVTQYRYNQYGHRNSVKENTKSIALNSSRLKMEAGEIIANKNFNLDYPENKEEVTKSENYLALSDTDTISCYTVPTP